MKNSKIILIQTNEQDTLFFDKLEIFLNKLTLKKDFVEYNSQTKNFNLENKYFKCKIDLKIINLKLLDSYMQNNFDVEGLLLVTDAIDANNLDVIFYLRK